MGKFPFCQVGNFGFFLIILLSLNMCYGNDRVTVNVQGFIKCADCTPVGVRVISPDASSATGRRLVVDAGNLKLINGADSSAACPGKSVQNVLSMISKSLNNFKQEDSTMIRKLRKKTSTISWPFHRKNEGLIDIPPSPGNSFEFPISRLLKAFLSPRLLGHLMETFPASVKKNFIISRKLLTFPGFPSSPQLPPLPPPQYSQRLVPSTAPAPMVMEPHDLIPGPASLSPMHSPGPIILQKPKPAPHRKPPVSVQQPPTATLLAPIYSNPTTSPPPVPKSRKPVPPPLQSQSQTAPVYPPVSPPTSMSHPSTKPVHNSAPSPLSTVNPTPRKKTFYSIPKAPPIPQLPPVPRVPRRYFNFPKYGSQPASPPS